MRTYNEISRRVLDHNTTKPVIFARPRQPELGSAASDDMHPPYPCPHCGERPASFHEFPSRRSPESRSFDRRRPEDATCLYTQSSGTETGNSVLRIVPPSAAAAKDELVDRQRGA